MGPVRSPASNLKHNRTPKAAILFANHFLSITSKVNPDVLEYTINYKAANPFVGGWKPMNAVLDNTAKTDRFR